MSNTATQLLNVKLAFLSSNRSSLTCNVTQITLIKLDFKVLQCNLDLQLPIEVYGQVQTQALFNLNPEIQTSKSVIPFQPDLPIALTISLKPDLLLQLADHRENLADYFAQLVTEQPDHPLLFTENWFVLQVKQQTPSGEIGYRTFWDYVSPSLLFREDVSSDAIADGLVEFFQSWVESNLPEMTQTALTEVVKEFSQGVEEQLSESDLETLTQDAIATIFSELIEGFDRWSKGESLPQTPPTRSLLPTVQTFFQQDGWDFRLLNSESMLQLAFEGRHDRWTCYAQTHEDQQQFLFYSICPIKVFPESRSPISEFLTRANYGMVIGNFEFDWEDGEIRYKTSLDVTNDRLTSALIKQLVYTNVLTMDEYLPGIQAVLNGVTPIEALRIVEQSGSKVS